MTKPVISVLKRPPQPMYAPPVRHGVLQQKLLGEQGPAQELRVNEPNSTWEPVPPHQAAPSREGWIEAPLEPTEAMLAAGVIQMGGRELNAGANEQIAKDIYTAMINARFDEPPVDTQALFGASSAEIKSALELYRKMKAPKKRKAKV